VSVKQDRLLKVIGLFVFAVGLGMLAHWALLTETLRNGQPLLGVLLVAAGIIIVNRRSNSG
jgi:uncharacterized membrane protein